MSVFAPVVPARGAIFSARARLGVAGPPTGEPPVTEQGFYEAAGS